jgi:spermidine synthase
MMRRVIGAVLLCAISCAANAELIHRERSLYQTILVNKSGSTVCLQFSVRRDQRNQSCIDQRRPKEMVFTYTKMMMSALLLNPNPERVLIAGLGGGTLPTALAELFPEAQIDIVEIDPAVVAVAKRFFGFTETAKLKVFTQDARVFTKRALIRNATYDLIMLDAYNGDYIPEHLMTREYLNETKSLLTDNGIIAANTFTVSRLYDHESATYYDVFGEFFNLRTAQSSNRVILTSQQPLPNIMVLGQRAKQLEARLRPFGVNIRSYPKLLSSKVDWDDDVRILTDQYSPVNLLQNQ